MSKLSIDRILQSQGFGTRKWCRRMIEDGELEIAGERVSDYRREFETEGLEFIFAGEEWLYRQHIYVALNKPSNFECSRKPSHHPGVLTLFPDQFTWRDVQPVGRLDHDTTGLLLLSDNGAFIHAQSSPTKHIPKLYIATTYDPVTPALIDKLLNGVLLHDEPAPLKAESCNFVEEFKLEVILEQGKYHQVKRMLAAAGNHCVALSRSSIGGLKLSDLQLDEGDWCYLNHVQLDLLKPSENR